MKRLCLISPRYGVGINGGAEQQCRLFAERLSRDYEVTVLTSCAADNMTWRNEYEAGESTEGVVRVLRFPAERERSRWLPVYNKLFRLLGRPAAMEARWIAMQGPFVPQLTEYLCSHRCEYDAFLFFTYLYYPTVYGLPEVSERAVFFPEAHREPMLYFRCVGRLFWLARAVCYNTEAEMALVESEIYGRNPGRAPSGDTVGNPSGDTPDDTVGYTTEDMSGNLSGVSIGREGGRRSVSAIGGIGIEVPEDRDGERFRRSFGAGRYILYVGRISAGKGCDELIEYYSRYTEQGSAGGAMDTDTGAREGLSLVMLGVSDGMAIPERRGIIAPGFVSERDKWDAIAGARAVIVPSRYESLSMILLEAMGAGTPAIVYGGCEVLRDHCDRSGGALMYEDYESFADALDRVLAGGEEINKMTARARSYVAANYCWDDIIDRVSGLIEAVAG